MPDELPAISIGHASASIRMLILEDVSNAAETILASVNLKGNIVESKHVKDAFDLQTILAKDVWDVVLADQTFSGCDALCALAIVQQADVDLPVIIVADVVATENAVDLMRAGARDVVLRHSLARLGAVVDRVIEESQRQKSRRLTSLQAEELAAIVQSSDAAIIGADVAGMIRTWNPAAERIFGWTANAVVGQSISMIVPTDKLDELTSIMTRLYQGETFEHFETVRQRPDGSRVDVCLTISLIRNDTGGVVGTSTIGHVVNARNQAKFKRHELAEPFLNLFEHAVIGIFRSIPEGRYLTVNSTFARIFGYDSTDELLAEVTDIGRQLYVEPKERSEYLRQMIGHDSILGFECQCRRRDGTRIWVRLDSRTVRDESGTARYFEGFLQDITEHRRAAQSLRESEVRLRTILDEMPVLLDAFDEPGRLVAWNRECERVTGYSAAEMLGNPCALELLYPDPSYREQMIREWSQRGNDYYRWEWDLVCKDGSSRTIAWSNISSRVTVAGWARWGIGSDVTDRRRAQDALRASEERYRGLIESIPPLVWVYDGEGKPLLLNQRWYEYTGQTPEQAASDRWHESLHPDDVVGAVSLWERCKASGEPYSYEYRLRGTDGAYRWFLSQGTRVTVPGEATQWVGTCTNIDDRRRMESELQRTTHLLHAIADGTSDSVFVKDLDGRYLFCNPGTAQLLGRAKAEILGRDDTTLFEPESARRVREDDLRVMAGGQMEIIEEDLTAAGITRTYHTMKGPYRNNDGKIVGVIGIARDISDRKEIEAERNELLERLQLQISRMPIAYILYDSDIRYVDWNPAAERIFGYSRDEIIGQPLEILVHPEDRDQVVRISNQLQAGDVAAHSVNRNVTKDGRVIICEWHNTPLINPDGDFTGVLSMTLDVTERVQAEAARRESAEQQAAILNALPAHVALLDHEGTIIAVNTAWQHYAEKNALGHPRWGIGCNYLDVCRNATGDCAREAQVVAAGIEDLLKERVTEFQMEYPCHSPAAKQWYQVIAIPFYDQGRTGAVIMHADVTAMAKAESALRASEQRFRAFMDNSPAAAWVTDREGRIVYLSEAYTRTFRLPPLRADRHFGV